MLSEGMKALLFRCLQTPSFAVNIFYLWTMQADFLRTRMVNPIQSVAINSSRRGQCLPGFLSYPRRPRHLVRHDKSACKISTERAKEMHRRANLPRFGPMTEKESLRMDLTSTMGWITELEELVARLRAENDLLKSQVYRFENVKEDDMQLRLRTGLSSTMWTNL